LTASLVRRRSALALDHPNARSLHAQPTPRTGGAAIMAAVILADVGALVLVVAEPTERAGLTWILGLAGAVAVFSFVEDLHGLSPIVRLVLQGSAAGLLLWALHVRMEVEFITLPPAGAAVTMLFIMWMMNLYNFMDGIDGLAAGMTIIGFGFLAYHTRSASPAIPLTALFVACAGTGFLPFNFAPARIFLGDVGSVSIGFLAGGLCAAAVSERAIDLVVPLMLFFPFIVDATATLLQRLLRGEKVWQPHRQHWYQRLVLAGWTHRQTTLAEYVLMMTCGILSVIYAGAPPVGRVVVLAVFAGILILMPIGVSAVEQKAAMSTRSV
jgi:UDP-N-acetylmuramyl pentapeptide phosphotransferase/UDP-N-acetylglucosamine-1-phosphate transferase